MIVVQFQCLRLIHNKIHLIHPEWECHLWDMTAGSPCPPYTSRWVPQQMTIFHPHRHYANTTDAATLSRGVLGSHQVSAQVFYDVSKNGLRSHFTYQGIIVFIQVPKCSNIVYSYVVSAAIIDVKTNGHVTSVLKVSDYENNYSDMALFFQVCLVITLKVSIVRSYSY